MATLFGSSYTRAELLQHVGDISQFAGVRVGELGDGFERGVRVADFRTGSGFEFSVLVDRGLDITWAAFGGASISNFLMFKLMPFLRPGRVFLAQRPELHLGPPRHPGSLSLPSQRPVRALGGRFREARRKIRNGIFPAPAR